MSLLRPDVRDRPALRGPRGVRLRPPRLRPRVSRLLASKTRGGLPDCSLSCLVGALWMQGGGMTEKPAYIAGQQPAVTSRIGADAPQWKPGFRHCVGRGATGWRCVDCGREFGDHWPDDCEECPGPGAPCAQIARNSRGHADRCPAEFYTRAPGGMTDAYPCVRSDRHQRHRDSTGREWVGSHEMSDGSTWGARGA